MTSLGRWSIVISGSMGYFTTVLTSPIYRYNWGKKILDYQPCMLMTVFIPVVSIDADPPTNDLKSQVLQLNWMFLFFLKHKVLHGRGRFLILRGSTVVSLSLGPPFLCKSSKDLAEEKR